MRHGIAFRKLSRMSSHRMLMLRNLVSSLLEHEQVETTVAKAKEAARMAEWVITWGKKGTLSEKKRAESFLMNPQTTVPKLFQVLSHRYINRPGGYTRILKHGHRKGDHAPTAILELVDGPKDLKFAVTAKAVGRELSKEAMRGNKKAQQWAMATEDDGQQATLPAAFDALNPRTKEAVARVLRYRDQPSPILHPDSTDLVASSSSSTYSHGVGPNFIPSYLPALRTFEGLAREAYFRAAAISKVPAWQADEQSLEAMQALGGRTPITAPGYGRKVWAGQEDLSNLAESQEDIAADLNTLDEAEAEREARLAIQLKQKLRHPQGRNGLDMQRSALRRAKGQQAAPRTLEERRTRADLSAL